MRYYATKTIKGFFVVKAKTRNDIPQILSKNDKQEIRKVLIAFGMSKRDIRNEHIAAAFWTVTKEEVETYIKERETATLRIQNELTDFKEILSSDKERLMFTRKL